MQTMKVPKCFHLTCKNEKLSSVNRNDNLKFVIKIKETKRFAFS